MDNHTPEFAPELVDVQIDQLLAEQSPDSQNIQLINDLQEIYQGDDHSLKNVWKRLGLEEKPSASMEQSASAKVTDIERNQQMHQTQELSRVRVYSLIIAACITAMVVGSMLFISYQAHQAKNGQKIVVAPRDLYISDNYKVFKFDPQTRKPVWQVNLKNVSKIISAGNVVYILQSEFHPGVPNSVMALDASSGHTLWDYVFPKSKLPDRTRTIDMVLAQNRLYVGFEKIGSGMPDFSQIYILKVSDGTKLSSYSVPANLGPMAASDSILAVTDGAYLRVSDLSTGKGLWQKNFPASVSPSVPTIKIVNGLVYVVILENGGNNSGPQSSIRAYSASSGHLVWRSPTFPSDALSFFSVDQNVVYFGTTQDPQPAQKKPVIGRMYAYNIQEDKQLWNVSVAGATFHQPFVSNGMVYIAADSGPGDNVASGKAYIIALSATTGSIKWQKILAGNYINGFCASDGIVYASSYSIDQGMPKWEKSVALNASDGHMLWEDLEHDFYYILPAE